MKCYNSESEWDECEYTKCPYTNPDYALKENMKKYKEKIMKEKGIPFQETIPPIPECKQPKPPTPNMKTRDEICSEMTELLAKLYRIETGKQVIENKEINIYTIKIQLHCLNWILNDEYDLNDIICSNS
jgi:hypothetical protein